MGDKDDDFPNHATPNPGTGGPAVLGSAGSAAPAIGDQTPAAPETKSGKKKPAKKAGNKKLPKHKTPKSGDGGDTVLKG